jgi:5-methylcytosine-specific restriction enzyme A
MPIKPLRPCKAPTCNTLTANGYCDNHMDQLATNRTYYDRYLRDKESATFYKSKAWLKVREQALMRDNRLCQHCLKSKRITFAVLVDHIIPLKVARNLGLSLDNLQSMCNACHRTKTEADKRKYG